MQTEFRCASIIISAFYFIHLFQRPHLSKCTWPTRTGAWSRGCAGTSLSHSWERKELLGTPRPGFFSKHSSLVFHGDELFWGENIGVALSDVKAPEISSDLFQHQECMSASRTWTSGYDFTEIIRGSVLTLKQSEGFCAWSITSTSTYEVHTILYYGLQSCFQHTEKTKPKLSIFSIYHQLHKVWHKSALRSTYAVYCMHYIFNYVFIFISRDALTCSSPTCSVPPGPVNKMRRSPKPWSRKSSKAFWFSSAPMKRFHLSVFSRRAVKTCSLTKSTRSSERTLTFSCPDGTRTPPSVMLRERKRSTQRLNAS